MNLTIAELKVLPLPAALFDSRDHVIAQTPEWDAALPGAIAYLVRNTRLVISTAQVQPACESTLSRLLVAMDAAADAARGRTSLEVRMLAASLRIMAGREVTTAGTTHDVIDYAQAGIRARTGLVVEVEGRPAAPVLAPEVAALVLVQFAANAERHTRVSSVTISQSNNAFHVRWAGESGGGGIATARQRGMRERWGMAFARIAADTIGGAIYPPFDGPNGTVSATLELGLNRLALPLAKVLGGVVLKATRAWDEETGLRPGFDVATDPRGARCLRAAVSSPGRLMVTDGWWARASQDQVWIAVPPDGILDRARDVLDGLVHERALWEAVSEPTQSLIFALASLLAALLGTPLPRVPGDLWTRKFSELARAFGLRSEAPTFDGMGAIDPRIAAYLAANVGDGFIANGENLLLRVRADCIADPLVQSLLRTGETAIRLS